MGDGTSETQDHKASSWDGFESCSFLVKLGIDNHYCHY